MLTRNGLLLLILGDFIALVGGFSGASLPLGIAFIFSSILTLFGAITIYLGKKEIKGLHEDFAFFGMILCIAGVVLLIIMLVFIYGLMMMASALYFPPSGFVLFGGNLWLITATVARMGLAYKLVGYVWRTLFAFNLLKKPGKVLVCIAVSLGVVGEGGLLTIFGHLTSVSRVLVLGLLWCAFIAPVLLFIAYIIAFFTCTGVKPERYKAYKKMGERIHPEYAYKTTGQRRKF